MQPGCTPPPAVTQDGDHQLLDGGEASRAAVPAPPSASRMLTILARAESEASRGSTSARLGWPPPLLASGGGNHPPALRRRRPPAMPGKANCCCPARMQHSALFLAFVARTRARTCRCALERPAFTGAASQTPSSVLTWWWPGKASPPSRPSVAPTGRPPALMAGSHPLSGDANESLPVAASVLGPWLLLQRSLASRPELVAPQAPRCGGCSSPRGRNRCSVCDGTLNAGLLFIVAVGA
jgi:hypothetical protein